MSIKVLHTEAELNEWHRQQNNKIHFVPTMGALHLGHAEIIKVAKKLSIKNSGSVLVSIFVNPLQFNENEDFARYPKNLDHDCNIAWNAGANAIWAPSYEDVFPGGEDNHFKVEVPKRLTAHLCGANRKGHFDGVASVVIQLLKLVKPSFLFLGEKDWQQLVILRQLVEDFALPIEIKSIGTVRENDGLACSSRNQYLNNEERKNALNLSKELAKASHQVSSLEPINLKKIKSSLEKKGLKVEYIETVDIKKLVPINYEDKLCLLAAAVQTGKTRLIDHTFLMKRRPIVAIDGPAGAGKSTVTKAFAQRLGLLYLDTGAMYRAVTWLIQEKKLDIENEKELLPVLENINLDMKISQNGEQKILINHKDITSEIRTPNITSKVSLIAANHSVRKVLTQQQQNFGINGGLVAEGRDIGTAVFPDAEIKIFLTASTLERAKRRLLDLQKRGFAVEDLQEIESQIIERDRLDSTRDIAPLVKAKDAKEVFTDGKNIDEVIETLIRIFRSEIPEEVWPTPFN